MEHRYFRLVDQENVRVIHLTLPNALDALELDQLTDLLLDAVTRLNPSDWILDLTSVPYAGSATLGLLVNLRQRIKDGGGRLVLCCLSARLMSVFQTSSMERLFTICRTREEALNRLEE